MQTNVRGVRRRLVAPQCSVHLDILVVVVLCSQLAVLLIVSCVVCAPFYACLLGQTSSQDCWGKMNVHEFDYHEE